MNTEKSRNLRDDCKNWGLNQPTAPLGLKFSDWSIQMESYIKKIPGSVPDDEIICLQLFVHALLTAFAQLSTDKKKNRNGIFWMEGFVLQKKYTYVSSPSFINHKTRA